LELDKKEEDPYMIFIGASLRSFLTIGGICGMQEDYSTFWMRPSLDSCRFLRVQRD
jgi:hypothetical protein